eukprot:TRINITY_DN65026_c0_g1_i1.p1 TRINITY_DN65026_c0_g1~~TRINITY_DN65026_c0_g1_i1.p1  ORF type:complete len:461 (+),score=115.25 TRINITY_DN65026_c0_g1_i1:125-1507(+)
MIPDVLLFCLGALVLIIILYLCMKRVRAPPGNRRREPLVVGNYLPGAKDDPGDQATREQKDAHKARRPVCYLLLNAGHTADDSEPPKDSSTSTAADIRHRWQEYNRQQHRVKLSKRGEQQCKLARREPVKEAGVPAGPIYHYLKERAIAVYAAHNLRCMQTAEHLMKINAFPQSRTFDADEQLNPKVSRIDTIDSLTPYGTSHNQHGVSVGLQELLQALSREGQNGTWEDSLEQFYTSSTDGRPRTDPNSHRTVRERLEEATQRVLGDLKEKLEDLNNSDPGKFATPVREPLIDKKDRKEIPSDKRPKDHVVVVIGQTPFLNALACVIAEHLGHTQSWIKKKIVERDDVGFLDGFIIGLAPHFCEGKDGSAPVYPEHLCCPTKQQTQDYPFVNYDDTVPDDKIKQEEAQILAMTASPNRTQSPAGSLQKKQKSMRNTASADVSPARSKPVAAPAELEKGS